MEVLDLDSRQVIAPEVAEVDVNTAAVDRMRPEQVIGSQDSETLAVVDSQAAMLMDMAAPIQLVALRRQRPISTQEAYVDYGGWVDLVFRQSDVVETRVKNVAYEMRKKLTGSPPG